jgi:hypothetical protein
MEGYVTFNTKESSIEKDKVTQKVNQEIKNKVYHELKQLESSCNLDSTRIIDDIEQARNIILDQAKIALFSGATQFEPKNFEQAWNHNEANDQEKWRMAIKKEFNDMNTKKVWEPIRRKISLREEELSGVN